MHHLVSVCVSALPSPTSWLMRGPNRLDRELVHLAKTPNTCMRACGCSSDVTTFRRRSHFLPLLRAQRATRTLLCSHTHTHTHTHIHTHAHTAHTHTHTHTTLMHCDNPRVDQTCAQELGVEPDKVLISNKLAWKRVPLTTPEPTFEPGVWVNLKNDAVQDISCVLVHPFSLQIIRTAKRALRATRGTPCLLLSCLCHPWPHCATSKHCPHCIAIDHPWSCQRSHT